MGGVSEGSVRPQDSEPYGGILLPRLCGIPNDRCRETKALSAYAHCTAVRVHSPTAKAVVLCPATPTHVEDMAVVIQLSREFSADGLEFIVDQGNIDIAVYGEAGKTRAMSRFLVKYCSRASELAQISSRLLVLGAKHCQRPLNYDAPYLSLTEEDRRLFGHLFDEH